MVWRHSGARRRTPVANCFAWFPPSFRKHCRTLEQPVDRQAVLEGVRAGGARPGRAQCEVHDATLPGGASTRRGTSEQSASNPHQTGFPGLTLKCSPAPDESDTHTGRTRIHEGSPGAPGASLRSRGTLARRALRDHRGDAPGPAAGARRAPSHANASARVRDRGGIGRASPGGSGSRTWASLCGPPFRAGAPGSACVASAFGMVRRVGSASRPRRAREHFSTSKRHEGTPV
jgi:hypothetical protein